MTPQPLANNLGFISHTDLNEASQSVVKRATTLQIRSLDFCFCGKDQYLRISRQLGPTLSQHGNVRDLPEELLDLENADELAVYRDPPIPQVSYVEYHVIHSVSYQVPVLYFFLHNFFPQCPNDIDVLYKSLVPELQRKTLGGIGLLGGIGMVNHPITGIPCWWIHPCNTAQAMEEIIKGTKREVGAEEYLMIWMGLVGTAVGLALPKEIAIGRL